MRLSVASLDTELLHTRTHGGAGGRWENGLQGLPCVAFHGCFMQLSLARRAWELIYLIIPATWGNLLDER